ncbi:hypothetical protein EGT36_17880 [Agrobacterium sp. FDAARGOS_525]|nr:hypothetical protein EGT36_17880 [Agrobacterium sp. FDAARGOS_525]
MLIKPEKLAQSHVAADNYKKSFRINIGKPVVEVANACGKGRGRQPFFQIVGKGGIVTIGEHKQALDW